MKLGELDLICKYFSEKSSLEMQSFSVSSEYAFIRVWDGSEVITLGILCQKNKPSAAIICNSLKATQEKNQHNKISLPKIKSLKKPITVYFDKHFKGSSLVKVIRPKDMGRLIVLKMADDSQIEVQLIPHNFNITCIKDGVRISLFKPRLASPITEDFSEFEGLKSLAQMEQDFLSGISAKPQKNSTSPSALLEKKIKKINKTINKVKDNLAKKNESPYRRLALELQGGTYSLEAKKFNVDSISEGELINLFYEKAKKDEQKIPAINKQLKLLENELQVLNNKLEAGEFAVEPKRKETILKSSGVKGRTKQLSDGFVVVRGKTAKENLTLLRKSPAWFLWLHAKDLPGSHALIHRNKNEFVKDAIIIEACQWLLQESVKNPVGSYEFVVAEKRYIKPIKGDRVGRVRYSNEKVFSVSI